jgi:hypothetical protein
MFQNRNDCIIWAAALIEGEGTITIDSHGIRVAVVMTDLDVLETIHKNFGGTLLPQKKRVEHYKDQWRWMLTNGKETSEFLELILPYLHKRRTERAKEAILYFKNCEIKKEKKAAKTKETRDIIRELGKSDLTHKNIAIKLNVDRSYVTHVLNGDYK